MLSLPPGAHCPFTQRLLLAFFAGFPMLINCHVTSDNRIPTNTPSPSLSLPRSISRMLSLRWFKVHMKSRVEHPRKMSWEQAVGYWSLVHAWFIDHISMHKSIWQTPNQRTGTILTSNRQWIAIAMQECVRADFGLVCWAPTGASISSEHRKSSNFCSQFSHHWSRNHTPKTIFA